VVSKDPVSDALWEAIQQLLPPEPPRHHGGPPRVPHRAALGARPRAQKAELIAQAQTLLAAEEHERRRRVVFIIDEAHLLAPDQLEELRLLTNAEMDSQSPFALLLVGQPTLARQLRLGVFAALDQRIATRYQLAPMDLAESAQYLRPHLALVDDDCAKKAVAELTRD
jgi:type II secretory pathway predicted ATPase ExeA